MAGINTDGKNKWKTIIQNSSLYLIATDQSAKTIRSHEFAAEPAITISILYSISGTIMNSVTHFEVPCRDQVKVQKFYEDVFGWKVAKHPDMDYHFILTT